MNESERCKAINSSSGTQCRNRHLPEHNGYCSMHYKKAHGLTMPQSLRKVRALRYTPVAKQLEIFGMTKGEIGKLRQAIPQIDSILLGGDDLRQAVDLAARILLVRTIAQPASKSVADCAVILARFALDPGDVSEIERRTLEKYSDQHGAALAADQSSAAQQSPSAAPSSAAPLPGVFGQLDDQTTAGDR